jgi:hypothetical protein
MPSKNVGSLTAAGKVTLVLARASAEDENVGLLQVSGDFTGVTGTLEATFDGTNWFPIAAVRLGTLALEQTPSIADATVRGWRFSCLGFHSVRLNVSAISGNTLTVLLATMPSGEGLNTPLINSTIASALAVSGGVTSSGPTGAGIGYATGAGGAVTQGTNRATGVTLSKLSGQITTHNASLAAAAHADFVVTNTQVLATDTIVANITPGGTGSPRVDVVNVAAGSFTLRVTNDHASVADTSADVINFAVFRGVAA